MQVLGVCFKAQQSRRPFALVQFTANEERTEQPAANLLSNSATLKRQVWYSFAKEPHYDMTVQRLERPKAYHDLYIQSDSRQKGGLLFVPQGF